ncbi:hypothetical protein K7X08_011836 [Anisodus acutangulus]|uniref:Ycf54 n=1 Tax=Anisodus acutangulus TaxID=402998 RepID=A0A9Q1MKB2_9SOLA|nr:hypothetical protein K7X08_011836 [Anisodus acutangulus]
MLALTALSVGSLGSCILNVATHKALSLWASPNTIVKPYNGSSWKLRTPIKTAVTALDSSQPTEKQETERKTYYFLLANAKFMLDEEEHFQEQLFERLRLYEEHNKEQDFWLVIEPKFLDKFPNITKRLKRPAVARLDKWPVDHVDEVETRQSFIGEL